MKFALIALVTMFFVVSISFIKASADRANDEVARLYQTITVQVKVEAENLYAYEVFAHTIGNVISPMDVSAVLNTGYASGTYLEAGHQWAQIVPADDSGSFPEDWESITGYDGTLPFFENLSSYSDLIAVDDIRMFAKQHSRGEADSMASFVRRFSDTQEPIGDFHIEYSGGYEAASFIYRTGAPVPVILSERVMEQCGLSLGEKIFLHITTVDDDYMTNEWTCLPAVICGMHNRNILLDGLRDAAIVPLDALEYALGDEMGYITFTFTLDPAINREIKTVRKDLQKIVSQESWTPLRITFRDEELQFVVGSMERSLSLLQMLYPVALAFSSVIGLILSVLLTFQESTNAAIMRVLGETKGRTMGVLIFKPLIVSIFGILVCVCLLTVIRKLTDLTAYVHYAELSYLLGSLGGSIIGALLITKRRPLVMLQARE